MAANERIKKYLEAGTVFGQVTRARAEEIVKELVSGGDIQRGQAQEWVDNLVDRSRKTSEQVLELVRHEVSAQLSRIDSSAVENLANQVADILKRSAEAGRSATAGATTQATNRAQSVRKSAAKSAKSATKTAKSATKTAKATATNTAKAARKAAGSVSPSGRKKTPAKKKTSASAPKKTAAKKTSAKKAPAKKSAGQEVRGQEDRGQEDRHGRIRHLSNAARRRLDTELVRRGLVATRTEALEAITSGLVVVSGTQADKAARLVAPNEPVVVLGPPPRFVSRGGEKLDAALTRFAIDVTDRRALDAGASTGGFTDCLLQRGAADGLRGGRRPRPAGPAPPDRSPGHRAGEGQRSLLDARGAEPGGPGFRPVFDRHGRPLLHLPGHRGARPHRPGRHDRADLVLLVKPQFEAGRAVVARGKGVVRDPEVWLQALGDVTSALQSAGTGIMGAMVSPLTGPAGNVEFLVHARKGAEPAEEDAVDRLLEVAVSEAVARRSATSTAD